MAITGLILLLFVVGHLLGNMQVYLGTAAFNHYAQMLQGLGEFLWIIRIVLIISLVLHIITSLYLNAVNNAAKPIKYQVKKYINAKLNSRTMIWTGLMIAVFVVYHLLHLTVGITNPDHYDNHEFYTGNAMIVAGDLSADELNSMPDHCIQTKEVIMKRHDVYKMVVLGFRNPIISLVYVFGVILLGFHLSHAIQSCFQTLGITGPKFTPAMVKASIIFSIIIVIMYISIPITILFRLVGGCV